MALERINLAAPIETRDGTLGKDSRTVNAVFEKNDRNIDFVKRPGLFYNIQIVPDVPPAVAPAQCLWSFGTKMCAVINNTLYLLTPSGTTFTVSTVGTTSAAPNNGKNYFIRTLLDVSVFFHNTVNGYVYTAAGVFSSPASLPSGPFVPGAVFLDNFIFVATANDNRIYSSNIGDPTTWNALAYIVFNQTNDTLVAIEKHLNYLMAFGKTSIQFFYDAGTGTSTVTPLGVAQSYTLETGCAAADSIVATDNTVIWIGATKTHGRAVYLLDGVSPIKVSTPSIDKCLETDGLTKVSAYSYKFYGHSLYILTLHTTGITIVYDIGEKMWTQWTQWAIASSDQPNPGVYSESYFRPTFYAHLNSVPYVLDDDTAVLYSLSNTTYQDNSQPIYCRSVTEIMDNGSTQRKFYGRLEIVGDKQSGAVLQVRHSGDDYNTWSNYRTVDLNASRPQLYLGGADRRRAWDMLCTSNTPLRLEAAEIDFRIGEMDQEQAQGRRG